MILVAIILLPILIIYPYLISRTIDKHTIKHDEKNNYYIIIKNIFIMLFLSILTLIIIGILLSIYDGLIPTSTSNLCTNTGGWTYSCSGDLHTAPILLLIIGIIIVIHHFISQQCIYKIFEYNKGIFKYIFIYIYMIIIYFLNFIFLFYLYGLFISVYYNMVIVEILRFLVFISPTCLFIISTFIYTFKDKN